MILDVRRIRLIGVDPRRRVPQRQSPASLAHLWDCGGGRCGPLPSRRLVGKTCSPAPDVVNGPNSTRGKCASGAGTGRRPILQCESSDRLGTRCITKLLFLCGTRRFLSLRFGPFAASGRSQAPESPDCVRRAKAERRSLIACGEAELCRKTQTWESSP
jgi:hypothetical protein